MAITLTNLPIATPNTVIFDIAVTDDGRFITPAVMGTVPWYVKRINASGTAYDDTIPNGFGNANFGGVSFTADGSKLFINHNTAIYRATYNPVDDDYDYDGWSTTVSAAPRALAVNPSGTLLAVGSGNNLIVIRTDTKAVVLTYAMSSLVEGCEFSPDGQYLAAGARSHAPRVFKVSGLTVTHLQALGAAGEGNWNVSWHNDSDHVALAQVLSGTLGVHIYKLSGVDTFTKLSSPFSDGGLTVGSSACSYAANGMLFIAANAVSDFRAYSRSGDVYTRETLTGGPTGAVTSIKCARNAGILAIHKDATTPYADAFSFPYFEGVAVTESDLGYPVFSASGEVDAPIGINATPTYPVFGTSGSVDVPIVVNGENIFPVYDVSGAAGAFPKSFNTYANAPTAYLASVANTTFTTETPTEPFVHGGWSYPLFSITGELLLTDEANGSITYPVYQIYGLIGELAIDSGWSYPTYQIAADLYNIREVEADIQYPFFDADILLKLTDNINGDLVYPGYQVEYLISATSINAAFNYPIYEISADVNDNYIDDSNLIYPIYSVLGEIEKVNSINADLIFPVFGASGNADVEPYSEGFVVYPNYIIESVVNAPIGTSGDIYYPSLSTNGVVGIKVSINGDTVYPKFTIDGDLGFSLAIDAIIRYPQYQIAGATGEPVDIDSDWTYPVFGTNFQIENYYTVEADIVVNIADIDGSVNRVGPRKNLFIMEN